MSIDCVDSGVVGGPASSSDERERRLRAQALRYLAVRDRTRKELEQKLTAKEPDAEIVNRVLAWLEERGYLDDRRFAEQWVRSRRETSGPLKLAHELRAKGIAPGLVQEQVQAGTGEGQGYEFALRLITRRLERSSSPFPQDLAGRQGLWRRSVAFLLRRGFSYEVASSAVEAALGKMTEGPNGPAGATFPFVDSP